MGFQLVPRSNQPARPRWKQPMPGAFFWIYQKSRAHTCPKPMRDVSMCQTFSGQPILGHGLQICQEFLPLLTSDAHITHPYRCPIVFSLSRRLGTHGLVCPSHQFRQPTDTNPHQNDFTRGFPIKNHARQANTWKRGQPLCLPAKRSPHFDTKPT